MIEMLRRILAPAIAATLMLASPTAWATWTSFEYRNADGEYRYGVKDGSSKLYLGLDKRKKANKTAKGLNKADKADKAASENGND